MSDVAQGVAGIGDIAAQLQSGTSGAGTGLGAGTLFGSMSMTAIIISLFAGLVGSAYFMYGKKTSNIKVALSGIALCVVPCFISNTMLLVVACLAMAAAPFII